ncbi:transposable element Tcb2 transposase [Trichonephila clavipes]|nr:transposable element Tcb2 transposase [Trichonephila clavipes]
MEKPGKSETLLQWWQARSMWNVTDWQKVVFNDESRFVLGTDDNRVRVWRRPAYDSRSTLIVMRGTLTGQRYVDDILRPHVGPFLNGLPGAIFQQDNGHPHTERVAQDFLRHFQTLLWPARSLDLSPVEHVHIALCSYTKATGDGFLNLQPQSSDENGTQLHKLTHPSKAGISIKLTAIDRWTAKTFWGDCLY